ncbi:Crp/Fnr family transcriptional regulator, partial [Bacillus toyonensis]|nr:Crp/Fnr family transcriptional regulator [Bacillus toyonensis]
MAKHYEHKNSRELCPRKVLIFKTLSEEEISNIASMTKHKKFKKGQPLIL